MLYFFLKNPFLSPRISVTNFDKLTKAHLAALAVANKGGSLSDVLADTQRLYDAFSRHLGEKSSSASLKKGQTENVESLVETVRRFIAEQEPNVQYQFRKEPGMYAQFYPNGIGEYRRAGKDELLTLFRRFTGTCLPHADKLGPEAVREAESLLDQLQSARNGQVHRKQTVKDLSAWPPPRSRSWASGCTARWACSFRSTPTSPRPSTASSTSHSCLSRPSSGPRRRRV